jgi:hypothetical protein
MVLDSLNSMSIWLCGNGGEYELIPEKEFFFPRQDSIPNKSLSRAESYLS